MVRLPEEFIAIKYPGYFFNTENELLYSVKVSGVLSPLRVCKPNKFNRLTGPAFSISVKGKRRSIMLEHLRALAAKAKENPQDEIFPVK